MGKLDKPGAARVTAGTWKIALLDLYSDGLRVVSRFSGTGILTAPAGKRKSGLYVEAFGREVAGLGNPNGNGNPSSNVPGATLLGESPNPPFRITTASEPFVPQLSSLYGMF